MSTGKRIVIDVERWKAIVGVLVTIGTIYVSVRTAVRSEIRAVANDAVTEAIAAHEKAEAGIYVRRDELTSSNGLTELRIVALQKQVDDIKTMVQVLYQQALRESVSARHVPERQQRGG